MSLSDIISPFAKTFLFISIDETSHKNYKDMLQFLSCTIFVLLISNEEIRIFFFSFIFMYFANFDIFYLSLSYNEFHNCAFSFFSIFIGTVFCAFEINIQPSYLLSLFSLFLPIFLDFRSFIKFSYEFYDIFIVKSIFLIFCFLAKLLNSLFNFAYIFNSLYFILNLMSKTIFV